MPMVKRRTVSFDEFVQNGINLLRGYAMIKGFDIDFTTVINLLAEYGLRKMYETAQESEIEDPLLQQVFTKYLDYDELKKWGIIDEWKDLKEYMEFSLQSKKVI